MDTKQQLLAYLEAHRGEYLSGETLAQQLHISRAAVWVIVLIHSTFILIRVIVIQA